MTQVSRSSFTTPVPKKASPKRAKYELQQWKPLRRLEVQASLSNLMEMQYSAHWKQEAMSRIQNVKKAEHP